VGRAISYGMGETNIMEREIFWFMTKCAYEKGRKRKKRESLLQKEATDTELRIGSNTLPEVLNDLNVPGFKFHGLHRVPKRYSIHVNGPWCITFEWKDGEALRFDLEQYH